MRINVLQHTPNEGPGSIQTWAHLHGHDLYIYHAATFKQLPTAENTDFLVILGGPMSPNDDFPWIEQERQLIQQLLDAHKPMFGACFGAQQIAKTMGARISAAPHKEVGWAPIFRQADIVPGMPEKIDALHWHQEMFDLPDHAHLLYSSKLVKNQAFIVNDNVVGFQCHLEPEADNLREIAINDVDYPQHSNDLQQTSRQIIQHGVPTENQKIMFKLLDYLNQ